MTAKAKQLLTAALALPPDERALLARELIESLDEAADPDAASAWVAEIERRSREIDDGSAALEDWGPVRDQIVARLRAR